MKLKAYKLFENSDADLSWLLFLKKPTCDKTWIILMHKMAAILTKWRPKMVGIVLTECNANFTVL